MKVQFKYAFRTGLSVRLPVFAVIFTINSVFLILGWAGVLPLAAHITAVSLSSTAIAVMMVFNVISDISVTRRIYTATGAYLYALTPTPRRKILLSSVIANMVMDIVTMAFTITSVVLLSFNLADGNTGAIFWDSVLTGMPEVLLNALTITVLLIAFYLFVSMVILFCIIMRKSVFFNKPAGGLLAALLPVGICAIMNFSHWLIAPFGSVTRDLSLFFSITVGYAGMIAYVVLLFISAAILFILSSKLLERRINI